MHPNEDVNSWFHYRVIESVLESYFTLRYYYSPEEIRSAHLTDFDNFLSLLNKIRQILLKCGYQINGLESEDIKNEFQRTLRYYGLD